MRSPFRVLVDRLSEELTDADVKQAPTSCEYYDKSGHCNVNSLVCPHFEATFHLCKVREAAQRKENLPYVARVTQP